MHKDIKGRVKRVAEEAGHPYNDMRDALVVLGLVAYYNLKERVGMPLIPVSKAVDGAIARARRGDEVNEEEGRTARKAEEDALLLSWQISRETGSE